MRCMQKEKSGSPVRRFEPASSSFRNQVESKPAPLQTKGAALYKSLRGVQLLNFLRLLDQGFWIICVGFILAQHAMRVEEAGVQCDREPHHLGICFGSAVEHGN